MPLVRYTGNRNPGDRTGSITVGSGKIVLGGEPLEVTDEELGRMQRHYKIDVVDAEATEGAVTVDLAAAVAAASAEKASEATVTLSSPSGPVATPAAPSTPSASGSSTPTPPAQGN